MLNEAIRNALAQELELLRAKRLKLDEKIQALEKILNPLDEFELFAVPMSASQDQNRKSNNGSKAEGLGLRACILDVLTRSPNGLISADIVKGVVEMGYRTTGSTSLATLVAGELFRLKKKGKIIRTGRSYTLAA